MSKENPRVTQELRWKDAWNDEENEFARIKYRRRGRKVLPDPWIWDTVREDRRDRNWKRYRRNQWKVNQNE